ncbi:threonine--tRNA ligase [Buchnera aphidicola]|uniref:threonine--tRNA ligase n=1 Tax=Buchnera aphidicola TaxID=9 RepID=UPI0030EBB9B2
MLVIKFSNKKQILYKKFVSIRKILKDQNINFKNKKFLGIFLNDKIVNLDKIVKKNSKIKIISNKSSIFLNIIRNSCLQLFSYSIKNLWPDSKSYFGHINDCGFYCDIVLNKPLTEKKIYLIKKKMLDLSNRKYNIFEKLITFKKLENYYKSCQENYKLKFLQKNYKKTDNVKVYYHEDFIDLKLDDQVFNIKLCKNFKIQSFSGIQKKVSCLNQHFQRVYVTSWINNIQLKNYLKKTLDLKKRDHRKINKTLNLYHLDKNVPGMIFWHANGLIIFKVLKKFIQKKLEKYLYQEVQTPIFMDKKIWENSGHWQNYKNLMFSTKSENKNYCIKPMNCPGHIKIFNNTIRSYKDLPFRISEFGFCHRNEPSGSLHGLLRVRCFTQDDAHIFCKISQLEKEIKNCIKIIYDVYNTFSFKNVLIKLSTRPEQRIGKDKIWDYSESILLKVLKNLNLSFSISSGEGAFYGPKIEFELEDSLNRKWQCGTIQLDFYLPKRLNAFYINKKNFKKNPVLIHRAILGSIERFIGILIEEYSGKFPFWLSPIQIVVLSINKKINSYTKNIFKILKNNNIRVLLDNSIKNLSKKIKKYIAFKPPYIIICGNKEKKNSTISVRKRSNKFDKNIKLKDFIKKIIEKNKKNYRR